MVAPGQGGMGEGETADTVARTWTIIGIFLCVSIFVYLGVVARRAVDEELQNEPISARNVEETIAFLRPGDPEAGYLDMEGNGSGWPTESPCAGINIVGPQVGL